MANSYTISTTDGETQVTITAGAVNGNVTGSVGTDTDLILYGRGSFNWGQGIEQNLIRLTENWASPSEVTGASVNAQVPKDYSPTPNKGITSPMVGQSWFNKSNNRPYVYTATGWQNDAAKHGVQLNPAGTGAQVVASDLKVSVHSPDLYVHSSTASYGGNAHILFESTTVGGATTVTGSIHSSHDANDALYIRKFPTRDYDGSGALIGFTTTPLLESSNSLNGATNQIKISDTETVFNKPLAISGNSTGGYVVDADVPGLHQNTLTTKRVVQELIDLGITGSAGNYLPITGGTLTGSLKIEIDNNIVVGDAGGYHFSAGISTGAPTDSQNEGNVNIIGHNPKFRARTTSGTLNGEAAYILDIQGSTKGRYFARRGEWEANVIGTWANDDSPPLSGQGATPIVVGTGYPGLVNYRNGQAYHATNNPYGVIAGEDIVSVIKYASYSDQEDYNVINGFYIFDDWIEVVKRGGSGKGGIRTQNPSFNYSGTDPDYERTLTTIKSVKNYVASAITGGTGNFYVEGDNLEINEGSTPFLKVTGSEPSVQLTGLNDAKLNLKSQVEANIRMEGAAETTILMSTDTSTATGNTLGTGESVIEFKHKEDGVGATFRGKMGLLRDTNENVDYLAIENTHGSVEHNKLEVRQDHTRFTRDVKLENPVGHDVKLIIDTPTISTGNLTQLGGISFRQSSAINNWVGASATPQIDIVGSYHGLNIVINRGNIQDVLSDSTRDFSILEIQNRNTENAVPRIYLGNANQGYAAMATPAMPDNNVSHLGDMPYDTITTARDVHVATQGSLSTAEHTTRYYTSNRVLVGGVYDGSVFAYPEHPTNASKGKYAQDKSIGDRIVDGALPWTLNWNTVDSRYFQRSAGSGRFYAKLSLQFCWNVISPVAWDTHQKSCPIYVNIKSVETSGNVYNATYRMGHIIFDVSTANKVHTGQFSGFEWIRVPPNATHTINISESSGPFGTTTGVPVANGGTNYLTVNGGDNDMQDDIGYFGYMARFWALERA